MNGRKLKHPVPLLHFRNAPCPHARSLPSQWSRDGPALQVSEGQQKETRTTDDTTFRLLQEAYAFAESQVILALTGARFQKRTAWETGMGKGTSGLSV